MKNYIAPKVEAIEVSTEDILATSDDVGGENIVTPEDEF